MIFLAGLSVMSVQPASVSLAEALPFTRTLLTVTLTASKPQAGASVIDTASVPLVAVGAGADPLSPPPPQATSAAAAMAVVANKAIRENGGFMVVAFLCSYG